jgi:agmatine deiminase
MITNKETNLLFFSSLLEGKKENIPFWKRLKRAMEEHGVSYRLLTHTSDIWCRDSMPVQVDAKMLLQYRYEPDYLKPKKYRKTKSDVGRVIRENGIQDMGFEIRKSDLILDGGNVIAAKDKVILTDKVFTENLGLNVSELRLVSPEQRKEVISRIKNDLGVQEVIIIPRLSGDPYGHADGMVRFLNDKDVLINDDKQEAGYTKHFKHKLREFRDTLEAHGLNVVAVVPHRHYETNFYINYLEVGKLIFLPTFGDKKRDETALALFSDIFKRENVIPVPSKEIMKFGGVLNCITWGLNMQHIPNFKKQSALINNQIL